MLLLISASRAYPQQQKLKKKEKALKREVLNFDGGILFATDGSLSDQTCFKLEGRATAPDFFDDFKRIDDETGTEYRSRQEVVTDFPKELQVSVVIFDIPCRTQAMLPGRRRYLTQEMMKSLRLSFYWKRGVELRRIETFTREAATADLIKPFDTESKEELPKRYRWILEFNIPSAGIPLTDRLVLLIRAPDGRRVARVAARL